MTTTTKRLSEMTKDEAKELLRTDIAKWNELLRAELAEDADYKIDLSEIRLPYGADLRGAYLRGAYLQGADLRGADLRGAYLQGADLQGADGSKATLDGKLIIVGPIGGHTVHVYGSDQGPIVLAGCWTGTVDGIRERAEEEWSGCGDGCCPRNEVALAEVELLVSYLESVVAAWPVAKGEVAA